MIGYLYTENDILVIDEYSDIKIELNKTYVLDETVYVYSSPLSGIFNLDVYEVEFNDFIRGDYYESVSVKSFTVIKKLNINDLFLLIKTESDAVTYCIQFPIFRHFVVDYIKGMDNIIRFLTVYREFRSNFIDKILQCNNDYYLYEWLLMFPNDIDMLIHKFNKSGYFCKIANRFPEYIDKLDSIVKIKNFDSNFIEKWNVLLNNYQSISNIIGSNYVRHW